MPLSEIPRPEHPTSTLHKGTVEQALGEYDRILLENPDNIGILNAKVSALISLGRFGDAQVPARHAVSADPGSVDGWINLGVVLEHLDKLQEASEALERAVKISPYNAYARARLGIVFQKMDREDMAEEQNRKLQEIVFPHGYAGFYFSVAAFLIGLLLGGIRSVDGTPAAIAIGSQLILLVFFALVCKIYWGSLRLWQKIHQSSTGMSLVSTGRKEPGSREMYLAMGTMVLVLVAGILIGSCVWVWIT